MYYRVPPKGVRLVGGVWVIPNATNGLTLFSGDELRPNGPNSLSTIGAFKVATEPLQAWGNLHNLIGGSQEMATMTSSSRNNFRESTNRLGFQEPKSKKLLTFHPTESSRRTQTDAPDANGKNNKKCSSPSLSNPTKATKARME